MSNIFSCIVYFFCKKKSRKVDNPIVSQPIEWNETQSFLPPITEGEVIKVYDGDTITIAAKLPYEASPLYRFQIRLARIDSPEIKGKSEEEKKAAYISQKALESLILHKRVFLENTRQEKYGRILAEVYVMIGGKRFSANEWMLMNKFAIPYDGKTKKQFCDNVIQE
jgi:endonuclease YncB( thermonuclease family)